MCVKIVAECKEYVLSETVAIQDAQNRVFLFIRYLYPGETRPETRKRPKKWADLCEVVPILRFFQFYDFTWRLLWKWCTDSTILPILRFYLKSFIKVMYQFYDSSDSTVLPEDCHESDVPILRFFQFYDFLQWMKERGIFSWFLCYHFHDNLKVKS